MTNKNIQTATFGGGCFWCTEAIISKIKGVENVVCGYSGGNVSGHPTYREVCSGLTGHAEVIQITFDPNTISYHDVLIVFMTTHNPTTLNRQGGDKGTQYRSVIYYHNALQKEIADNIIKEMATQYQDPIITEISPLDIFYEAENDHQDYYTNNQDQSYCSFVIAPKLAKLRKQYADKLK